MTTKKTPGDKWRTPQEVINFIEQKFGSIVKDLCASDTGYVCRPYLTEEDNFFDDKWMVQAVEGQNHWMNPPYSGPLPFVKQAIKWADNGYAVSGILNHDTSTKWFMELLRAKAFIMPISGGRVAFLDELGEPINGNNKSQFMFYLAAYGSHTQHTQYVSIDEIYPNGKVRK